MLTFNSKYKNRYPVSLNNNKIIRSHVWSVRNTINSLLNVNGSVVNAFWRIQHSVPSGIIIFNNIGNKLNPAAAVRVLRHMPAGHEMKARERYTKPIIYLQRINAKSRVWSLIRITDDIRHSFREYYIQLLFRINKTWLPKTVLKMFYYELCIILWCTRSYRIFRYNAPGRQRHRRRRRRLL